MLSHKTVPTSLGSDSAGLTANLNLVLSTSRSKVITESYNRRSIQGDWFQAYVTQIPVCELRGADIPIMAYLSSHKRTAANEKIEATENSLRLLLPYSPHFYPIETALLGSPQGNDAQRL